MRSGTVLLRLLACGALVTAGACTRERDRGDDDDDATAADGDADGDSDGDADADADADGDADADADADGDGPDECGEFLDECDEEHACCGSAPNCDWYYGRCCIGSGARDTGSPCNFDGECCAGHCGDDWTCCTPEHTRCLWDDECCAGLVCGTELECCAAIGTYCGDDRGSCCPGTICSNQVRDLGFGSSTTEPDRCCVPGGGECWTDEDCCIENDDINGVQCWQGLCRRSIGSRCERDEQCTYECQDGECN